MALELGGIALERVHRIETREDAGRLFHHVPGQDGDVAQDLGRASLHVLIEGIFYGQDAPRELEALRRMHLARKPVDFLADLSGRVYGTQVTLDRFEVAEAGGYPDQFTYRLLLTEFVAPPGTAMGGGAVTAGPDQAAALAAARTMKGMEIPDMLQMGAVPSLSVPLEPLRESLAPVRKGADDLMKAASGLRILLGGTSPPAGD